MITGVEVCRPLAGNKVDSRHVSGSWSIRSDVQKVFHDQLDGMIVIE